jgi:hypothetical protein
MSQRQVRTKPACNRPIEITVGKMSQPSWRLLLAIDPQSIPSQAQTSIAFTALPVMTAGFAEGCQQVLPATAFSGEIGGDMLIDFGLLLLQNSDRIGIDR